MVCPTYVGRWDSSIEKEKVDDKMTKSVEKLTHIVKYHLHGGDILQEIFTDIEPAANQLNSVRNIMRLPETSSTASKRVLTLKNEHRHESTIVLPVGNISYVELTSVVSEAREIWTDDELKDMEY